VAVIAGLITEPIPAAAIGLMGLGIAAVSGLVASEPSESVKWALSGFAHPTIWLIFSAYIFADGYTRTGLGKRIALWLIRLLGKRTLGLGYAVAIADLSLAPLTPSVTARSAGTIYPIVKSLPPLYGSLPGATSRRVGAYLLYTALATTCVTSSMFLTASAPNLLAVNLINKTLNISLSWTEWFLGFLPVGIILFVMLPALLYVIYPPEIKATPEMPRWAAEEIRKLGRISAEEVALLGLMLIVLGLWLEGAQFINPTMAAIVAVAAMVLIGIVSWNDVLSNKQAWNVLVWFATLVTLADGLVRVHFVNWLGESVAPAVAGLPIVAAIVLVVGAFYFLHYLFASITAHTTALLPVFLTAAVEIPGLTPKVWALTLAYTLGIMGILTPYATGPSPIYYGSGYIEGKDFWRYGITLGVLFCTVFMAVGIPWLLFVTR
jgi:L-tartrate/succinate antiporter